MITNRIRHWSLDNCRRRGLGTDGGALPRVGVIKATGDVDEEPARLGIE